MKTIVLGVLVGLQTGGDTSIKRFSQTQPLNRPAKNILRTPINHEDASHDLRFQSGLSDFHDRWVQAGASLHSRDGLGPYFNARSCEECHQKDGRGTAPNPGIYAGKGLLMRISVFDKIDLVPNYGGQIQDFELPGFPSEGKLKTRFTYQVVTYSDGKKVTLKKPHFQIVQNQKGPLGRYHQSPRLAPQLIGLGLLENIPRETLEGFITHPNGGISGRLAILSNGQVGRFGWKAESASVMVQNAKAFSGDMGLTSSVLPDEECLGCSHVISGGTPEVTDKQLKNTEIYIKLLGVPERNDIHNPDVIEGEKIFTQIGCISCHKTHITTGEDKHFPELSRQLIHPFTDLLLHDMGESLSDERPLPHAPPQEWRTPPLWGIGLVKKINPKSGFLHDGRAETLEEAILWHDGEALESKNGFKDLDQGRRMQLLQFLESL